jgi:RNA polymerase sigma factor (sigma-70 family)
VCTRLWSERRKELRYRPFSHEDSVGDTELCERNLLVSRLIAEACERESEADKVIRHLEVEVLRKHLLQILYKLSDKERRVIEMKYFEDSTGIKIAQVLAISEGRVSQLTKSALEKIGKAYLVAVEQDYRATYRKT